MPRTKNSNPRSPLGTLKTLREIEEFDEVFLKRASYRPAEMLFFVTLGKALKTALLTWAQSAVEANRPPAQVVAEKLRERLPRVRGLSGFAGFEFLSTDEGRLEGRQASEVDMVSLVFVFGDGRRANPPGTRFTSPAPKTRQSSTPSNASRAEKSRLRSAEWRRKKLEALDPSASHRVAKLSSHRYIREALPFDPERPRWEVQGGFESLLASADKVWMKSVTSPGALAAHLNSNGFKAPKGSRFDRWKAEYVATAIELLRGSLP